MSRRAKSLRGLELQSKWRVGEPLGEGACSVVYTAEPLWRDSRSVHVRLARPGATYVVKMSKLDSAGGAKKGKSKKRKLTEVERLANLLSGEHLAYMQVLNRSELFPSEGPFGYGEVDGYRYLVMERLGVPLDEAVTETPMDLERVGSIGLQMVESLEFLHTKGYVYVDMKPENIMLGRWNEDQDAAVDLQEARLVDFGLMVKYWTSQGHREAGGGGIPPGTPRFFGIALHRNGTAHCRRDDMEALGYVLLWCSSGGRLPWDDEMDSEDSLKQAKEAAGSGVDCCRAMGLPTRAATALGGYIDACRALDYADKPDYDSLKGFLTELQASPNREKSANRSKSTSRGSRSAGRGKSNKSSGKDSSNSDGKVRWSPDDEATPAKRRRKRGDGDAVPRTMSTLPLLYVYDHCASCTSVRFALGVKKVKHDLRFLMHDDKNTPRRVAGKKGTVPIWTLGDETVTGSLEIIRMVDQDDRFGPTGAIEPPSGRKDLAAWHAQHTNLWRLLQLPRFAHKQSILPEFQQRDSREHFQRSNFIPLDGHDSRSFGALGQPEIQELYDRALQMSEELIEQADMALLELAEMLHSDACASEGGLSYDDVDLWSKLRGISIVKGLQVPGKLHSYMRSLSELADVPLYWNLAI